MKVLVDTSVWSLALRRRAPAHASVDELRRLLAAGRAAMIGPIRQELLNGLRDAALFDRLRDHLRALPDEPVERVDYERAAEHFHTCRAAGIQGLNTDFLICAVAERHAMPILTTDADFSRYASLLPVALHRIHLP
ncbi:MAG: twitching motility protein PilT [Acidobacteria bacterium SCN 69-37]|nr:MAG: twitching motility protein PilT [Acidobacteria bacterium SCN 69-37]